MGLEHSANAPIEIMLSGKAYKVSAYTMADLGAFRQKIKSDKIKLIGESVSQKDDRLELTREILNKGVSDEELSEAMMTVEGLAFILWCMMKDNQSISYEDVCKLVTTDNLESITDVISELTPVAESKKKVKNP